MQLIQAKTLGDMLHEEWLMVQNIKNVMKNNDTNPTREKGQGDLRVKEKEYQT